MNLVIAYLICSADRESETHQVQVGPAERVFSTAERLFLTCLLAGCISLDRIKTKGVSSPASSREVNASGRATAAIHK